MLILFLCSDVPITHKLGMDVTIDQPNYNQYIRIIEVLPTEQQDESTFGTMVKLEIKTVKDGRIREKFLLTNQDQTVEVSRFHKGSAMCGTYVPLVTSCSVSWASSTQVTQLTKQNVYLIKFYFAFVITHSKYV